MSVADEGSFTQEYDPNATAPVALHIYCRMCRRTFSVSFKPRPKARLKCSCGYEATLAELDVFENEARAKDFANLYQKLYTAARDALRAANIKVPPSQKLRPIRDDTEVGSDVASPRDGNLEDLSDIASAYVGTGKGQRVDADAEEQALRGAVGRATGIIQRHDALSKLVEHLYCHRRRAADVVGRLKDVCRQDMSIAKAVIAEATRLKAAGKTARLSFTSFKHLAIVLEEEGDIAGALEVSDAARAIGLPGYDDRAQRLRGLLPKGNASAEKKVVRGASSREAPVAAKPAQPTAPAVRKGASQKLERPQATPPKAPPRSGSDAVIPSSHDLEAFDDLIDL